MSADNAAYAARFLRQHDRTRYFATLVVPRAARRAVTALHAFAAECAAVRDRVSEPALGEMRLQWWADALEARAEGVAANPVAAELLDAVTQWRLPSAPLVRLINARRFDLYDDPMPDVASFEGYAGETESVLHQLAAMVVNGGEAVESGDAAGHLGVAEASVGHLRAFGWHASRGRLYLPLAVFKAHGVEEAEIFAGTTGQQLAAALNQIKEMAQDHISAAERAIAGLPLPVRAAFAAAAVLPAQLRTVPPADKPFAPPAEIADWRKIGALWLWVGRQR